MLSHLPPTKLKCTWSIFIGPMAYFISFLAYRPQGRQWHPTPVLLPGKSHEWRSLVDSSPWGRKESDFTFIFHFHALEKEMATHSSILAWRIPGTEKPGGLPSMGSHRVGHGWSDLPAAAAAYRPIRNVNLFVYFVDHLSSSLKAKFSSKQECNFLLTVL